MADDYDGPSNVKFNAGFFQIQRIHEVQRMINIAKINPTTFNVEYNLWNYELWFNSLNALLDEVWPKLEDEKEKPAAAGVRNKMIELLMKTTIVISKSIDGGDRKMSMVDKTKWLPLHLALINYDNYVKELMDAHGWNNPEGDWEGEDEY